MSNRYPCVFFCGLQLHGRKQHIRALLIDRVMLQHEVSATVTDVLLLQTCYCYTPATVTRLLLFHTCYCYQGSQLTFFPHCPTIHPKLNFTFPKMYNPLLVSWNYRHVGSSPIWTRCHPGKTAFSQVFFFYMSEFLLDRDRDIVEGME